DVETQAGDGDIGQRRRPAIALSGTDGLAGAVVVTGVADKRSPLGGAPWQDRLCHGRYLLFGHEASHRKISKSRTRTLGHGWPAVNVCSGRTSAPRGHPAAGTGPLARGFVTYSLEGRESASLRAVLGVDPVHRTGCAALSARA